MFNHREKLEARIVSLARRSLKYADGDLVHRSSGVSAVRRGRGDKAGQVELDGQLYSSAKVVWIWHHGAFPANSLRHVNRIKSDDRIENLGLKLLDGTVEGAGHRWVARAPGARRNEVLGVFRTFEKALRIVETHNAGADLV